MSDKQSDDGNVDQRFAQLLKDPRFRNLKRSEKKVKVDKRFRAMFNNENFECKRTDKRGKPGGHSDDKDLSKFYDLSSEDEDVDEKVVEDVENNNLTKSKRVPDARGVDNDDYSDSSSDSEDSESEEQETVDHQWGELDKDVTRSNNVTRRIAICNVDWDRIKAVDLYVLLNSFKPEEGAIVSVKIFLSEFGKKRLEEENLKGPTELVEVTLGEEEADPYKKAKLNDDDVLNDECSQITEKLRKYQINRLKYYYAVVECESAETAVALYDELDGMEYESSASSLDLRFIPDDITFDETPVTECTSMPDFISYKPPIFITTALQQSKVRLTWDETDPSRSVKFQKAFQSADKNDDDINAYLATDNSSDEEEVIDGKVDNNDDNDNESETHKSKIDKYKMLLKSFEETNENPEDLNIEISWEPSLKKVTENIVEQKDKEKDLTIFEKEKRKKKARKTRRTSEQLSESCDDNGQGEREQLLDLVVMDEEDKKHFNYDEFVVNDKKRKSKRKTTDEDDFQMNLDDSRFSAIYTSSEYNIDQSNPHFKRTKGMENLVSHKQNYKSKTIANQIAGNSSRDLGLTCLVNSVKSKSRNKFVKR